MRNIIIIHAQKQFACTNPNSMELIKKLPDGRVEVTLLPKDGVRIAFNNLSNIWINGIPYPCQHHLVPNEAPLTMDLSKTNLKYNISHEAGNNYVEIYNEPKD